MQVNTEYDSDEEFYFAAYLSELVTAGIVRSYCRHEPLELAPSVRVGKGVLHRAQVYTPDFLIEWEPKHKHLERFFSLIEDPSKTPFKGFERDGKLVSVIEIKGGFIAKDEGRMYGILAKWAWQVFKIYVQRIAISTKPKDLFDKTFTPVSYLLTKATHKPRKLHYSPIILREFLER